MENVEDTWMKANFISGTQPLDTSVGDTFKVQQDFKLSDQSAGEFNMKGRKVEIYNKTYYIPTVRNPHFPTAFTIQYNNNSRMVMLSTEPAAWSH